METCARCGTEFMPGVANCPGCGWPVGKAYTPPPVVVEDVPVEDGAAVFVFDDEGNPQFAPEPPPVVIPEPQPEPVRVVAPQPPQYIEMPVSDVPQPWSRAGSPDQVPVQPAFKWGWALLGFFIWPVGLIYGLAGKRTNPAAAHAALIGGLIGLFFSGFGGLLNSCGGVWLM